MTAAASLIAQLMAMIAPAETAFRSRWRLSTLQRLNPELHQALIEQIGLYDRAFVTGSDDEARDQAEAMVRGWRAACAAMESPLQADDAYLTGYDPNMNLIVVIAQCRESGPRAERVLGQKVVTITPDEVASIVAGLNIIAEVKSLFPDAEVIRFHEIRPDEAASAREMAMRVVQVGAS